MSKLLGSILLIVGTSIGAGMLGLPIASAELGFVGSVILLVICWFVMLSAAFLILEVNLWLPPNTNLVTMAKKTIGPAGQLIAWLTYLLLLYSLLCAYITGGSSLFQNLLMKANIALSPWAAAILFTLVLGTVVYWGIRSVDQVNRGLMFLKGSAFIILICLLTPFISSSHLAVGNLHHITSSTAIMVTTTAFGWAILIPSLRDYFGHDIKTLKLAILIGSFIPLFCYIIWDAAIMGIIPPYGADSLVAILHSDSATGNLVNAISKTINKNSVTVITNVFTSICVLTSFLAVALCLTDFLADGLQIEKKGRGKIIIHCITFIPALLISIFFPNAFIKALEYAGIYCTVLLILLPAWMTWSGRYRRRIASGFRVIGGKFFLSFIILICVAMIVRLL